MEGFWQRNIIPQIATATIVGAGAIVVWFAICIAVTATLESATHNLPKLQPSTIVSLILLSPALLAAVPLFDHRGPDADYFSFIVQENLWEWFIILGILSFVLAVICYAHHRRYNHRTAFVWFTYVLIMGVPGAIGYWLHRRWPPTERCPRCGIDARRDRETCSHCGAVFPLPGCKGNEIFDTA